MRQTRSWTDIAAIGLSSACAIHCLALPALLVLLPSLTALPLENEAFHFWMVIAVLPISLFALTLGCKQHKRYQLLAVGLSGLALLVLALLLEDTLGENGEKILTLLGSSLLVIGHWFNYQYCQKKDDCKPCQSPHI